MTTFSDILDRAPTEVDRPKPLPSGTYTCVVNGLPEYGESSKKKTPFVRFTLKVLAADDDVDTEALNEWMQKAGGETRSLTDATIRDTYYLTEDAVYRLDGFHQNCGIELEDGVSRRQRNEQTNGCQLKVFIKHRPSEDGTTIFAEIGATAPIDE